MPQALNIRFDDDVVEGLRDRARDSKLSINRLVNDVMRSYLGANKDLELSAVCEQIAATERNERLDERLKLVRDLVQLVGSGNQPDVSPVWQALEGLADVVEILSMRARDSAVDPSEPDLDAIHWQNFRSSRLNVTGSDDEARRMFDAAKLEVEGRAWTWYRSHHDSDEAAKAAWRRQRLRYGLPVPALNQIP